jgi:hypothetical protein
MRVTVVENSPKTIIDLRAVFSALGATPQDDGPQPSVLGNTNSGLVSTDLSEAQLTLTFTPGKYGEATITIMGTYADGVSVQGKILVTVLPPQSANGGVLPLPVGALTSMTTGSSVTTTP